MNINWIVLLAIVVLAGISALAFVFTFRWWQKKRVASTVWTWAKRALQALWFGAGKLFAHLWLGAKWVFSKLWSSIKWVFSHSWTGIKWVWFKMKPDSKIFGWIKKRRKPKSSSKGGTTRPRDLGLSQRRRRLAKRIVLIFSIVTLGSGYVLYQALRYMFSQLAKKNIFVTFRRSGEAKAIMWGDVCIGYLADVENHLIDPDGYDVFKGSYESYAAYLQKAGRYKRNIDQGFVETKLDEDGNLSESLRTAIERANATTLFEELFGAYLVGLPPHRVFEYLFRWNKFSQIKDDRGNLLEVFELQAREKVVDSVYFRYTQYGIRFRGFETGAGTLAEMDKEGSKTLVLVKGILVFETITKNFHKTLFRTAGGSSAGDWLPALSREIFSRFRVWLGTTNWDTLITNEAEGEKKDTVEQSLSKICSDINGVGKDDLPLPPRKTPAISAVRDYGQKIVKIAMPEIDLEDTTLQEAYNRVRIAQRNRDANIAEAVGRQALAAAPILAKAQGFKAISEVPGGQDMWNAEQLGNIDVYAPGHDGVFLNVAQSVTGSPKLKEKSSEPIISSESK